jgi:predicted NBD/HSP70 family sugar kinase
MKNPQNQRTVTTGTNAEHARQHNRRVILEAIRQAGRLTRADLTRLTSLTAQTVSNIVSELSDEGVLLVHAAEKGGRGQPPVPLSINPEGGYSIGFHVEQHRVIGVLLDLLGVTQAQVTLTVSYPTFEQALPLILETVDAFRQQRPTGRFLGVGIALPGPFSVEGMTAVGPTAMSGWEEPSIPERLQQALGLPVLIENDATAASMGERLYGIASDLHNFVHLFIGSGLGAGLYLGNPDDQDLTSWDLNDKALLDAVDAWLEDAVPALRQAINILESVLDPQTILISGFLPEPILARLIARLEPLSRSISSRADRQYPRIQMGTAGQDAVALGAAALMILAEISPDYEALLKPE